MEPRAPGRGGRGSSAAASPSSAAEGVESPGGEERRGFFGWWASASGFFGFHSSVSCSAVEWRGRGVVLIYRLLSRCRRLLLGLLLPPVDWADLYWASSSCSFCDPPIPTTVVAGWPVCSARPPSSLLLCVCLCCGKKRTEGEGRGATATVRETSSARAEMASPDDKAMADLVSPLRLHLRLRRFGYAGRCDCDARCCCDCNACRRRWRRRRCCAG